MSSALVQARHVEILATLASVIARSSDLDSILEAALAAALSALDLQAAGIFLVHEETGELRATSHQRGVPAAYVATIASFRLGEGPVGQALKALRAEAAVKGVTLEERIEDVRALPGDERLLRLLLHHLVENAVKFTGKGGRVEVALGRDGDDALFLVRDDGIGIAREHHERIFEKFYAVDAGRSRAHAGAGIGLYLAREVVHIHAGVIRVASAPGEGASFEVRLPLRPRR